jgi:hypothetical protein
MSPYYEKMNLILKEEERFASALALEVVENPKLRMWMVLIPLSFLYFTYRNKRVAKSRKAFVNSYLFSRKRALEESLDQLKHGRTPEMDKILNESSLPEGAKGAFRELFSLLMEHYSNLLRSDGSDAATLVRAAYENRTHYLLFLARLNQAEKSLHRALKEHLGTAAETVEDVAKKMETAAERLRTEAAERLFA